MAGRLDRNQDQVIENAMEGDRRLTVFLKNGVPMRGKILAHDSYTIFMETEKAQALVYKHSVTSLRPARLKGPGPSGGGHQRRPGSGHKPWRDRSASGQTSGQETASEQTGAESAASETGAEHSRPPRGSGSKPGGGRPPKGQRD